MASPAILEHDALRPAVPSVQLALKHANSDDYFQQLLSVDSALQALDTCRKTLTLELRFQLERLVRRLERLQTAARKGLNSRARSLRKAKVGIMDLPNELLSIIFGHFKGWLDDRDIFFDPLRVDRGPEAMTIQNVRLTCRRFRDNSSHLLVRQLDVSPTKSSLERLEEAARHPEIWRGERVLRIDLRYYSAHMAFDIQVFSTMCCQKLRNKIDSYEAKIEYSDDGSSGEDEPDERQGGVAQLRRILDSWEPYKGGKRIRRKERRFDAAARALLRGHKRYRELFWQQREILKDGHFARVVAEAAASSHSQVWLSMTDNGRHLGDHGPDLREWDVEYSDLEELADPDFLVRSLIQPHAWWHAEGGDAGEIPQSLLYELPLAMRASKARLAGVGVNISRPFKLGLNLSQDQLSGLSKVAEGLEAFTFAMCDGINSTRGPRPSSEEMNGLYAYIRAAIGPQCVPNLWLDLAPMEFIVDEMPDYVARGHLSIEPLLCSPSWHRLRFARLEFLEMDLQDLRKLMGMLESKVRFDLRDIYLDCGTWAAALDCLRSKAASGSELLAPEGPDCARMTEAEYIDSFEKHDPIAEVSKATQYITSVEGVDNPCRTRDEATEANPEL